MCTPWSEWVSEGKSSNIASNPLFFPPLLLLTLSSQNKGDMSTLTKQRRYEAHIMSILWAVWQKQRRRMLVLLIFGQTHLFWHRIWLFELHTIFDPFFLERWKNPKNLKIVSNVCHCTPCRKNVWKTCFAKYCQLSICSEKYYKLLLDWSCGEILDISKLFL